MKNGQQDDARLVAYGFGEITEGFDEFKTADAGQVHVEEDPRRHIGGGTAFFAQVAQPFGAQAHLCRLPTYQSAPIEGMSR